MKTRAIASFTLTLSLAFCAGGSLIAQEAKPDTGNASGPSTTTRSQSSSDQAEKRFYPKMQHPPGFYEGALLMSFSYGRSIAPTGSLLRHEKDFDESMRLQINQGALRNGIKGVPETHYQASFSPEDIYQIDLEYGVWEHFGLGMSMFHYGIDMREQDYIYGSDKLGNIYYEPAPTPKTLFAGNAITALATYHPFSRKLMDPYLCLRVGGVGYTGQAHSGLYYDPNISSSKIDNGLGKIAGAGVGMNFFLAPEVGLKFEADYNRSYLSADQFSNRTLNNYSVQVGFFINYSAVAAAQTQTIN